MTMTKDDTVQRIRDIELRIVNALVQLEEGNNDEVKSELEESWRCLKTIRCGQNTSK